MSVGDIMSTLGDVQYTRDYHEYTGGVQYTGWIPGVHQRDTMSTPGDFGTNEKKPPPNFKDFYSRTFCDYAVVYIGLWNIRQLAKTFLSGSKSPDPNTFLASSLIKSL